jgi:Na+-driven multidrug efflux pump
MQAIFLPAMAIAFATAPVAGQNMGAGKFDRVRATFKTAMIGLGLLMLALTVLCQISPAFFIGIFTDEIAIISSGAEFLQIVSFNFVASGIVFICSGMFQAIGNTIPSLAASASRLFTFALPAVWMSSQPWFELHHLCYLSVATVLLQAATAWWLLSREMKIKLQDAI